MMSQNCPWKPVDIQHANFYTTFLYHIGYVCIIYKNMIYYLLISWSLVGSLPMEGDFFSVRDTTVLILF